MISGYSSEELSLLSPTDLFADSDKGVIADTIRQVFLTGEATVEADFVAKDQTKTPYFFTGALAHIDQKPCLVGMGIDITERVRAELKLTESEAQFRGLVEQGIAGSYIVQDGKFAYVNPRFAKIFGYDSAAELIGREASSVVAEKDRGIVAENIRQRIEGEATNITNEFTGLCKDGSMIEVGVHGSLAIHNGWPAVIGLIQDISEKKRADEEIQRLAFYDSLTQLPNRRLLLDRLQQALASSTRSGHQGALLFLDLDDFKTLNDTLGHDVGDLLLQQVAHRLTSCIREGDTVARLGGDEFVVMLEDLSDNVEEAATQTKTVGEKIIAALNQPYLLTGHRHHNTPSIGATLFSDHHNSVDELLKRADLAMYQAKAAGRNTLRFYDPEMQAAVTARAALEADLRQGLQQNQFLLYYQPQVDEGGRMMGAEALVRWRHPLRGLVSPADFIPLAEDTRLILPLGHWVLETACVQLVRWAEKPETAHLTLAVNVSASQFHNQDFVAQVLAVLDQTGADPRKLKLELTESLLLDDVEGIIAKMTALKAKGVGFALDDFGTGYSSLSYLKRLPLDQLKIDQSFVQNILTDSNDAAIARMIVALAQSMELGVIAEGVETKEQMEFLASLSCHAFQGYLFGRPLPAEEFGRQLKPV